MVDLLKINIREIAQTCNTYALDLECHKYHFHMLFKPTPLLYVPQFINLIKTITSGEIQRRFPEVKKDMWIRIKASEDQINNRKGKYGR